MHMNILKPSIIKSLLIKTCRCPLWPSKGTLNIAYLKGRKVGESGRFGPESALGLECPFSAQSGLNFRGNSAKIWSLMCQEGTLTHCDSGLDVSEGFRPFSCNNALFT